jgi:hypothetical protein
MALGTGQITTTTGASFVPELWSDDIAARYKHNLVVANNITQWDHSDKPGGIVEVPAPTRSAATNIFGSQGAALTFTAPTENNFTITINQHWATPKQIPDIAEKQFLSSYRKFITDDIGYSLAVAIDSFLWQTARLLAGTTLDGGVIIASDGATLWNPAANGNAGNASNLTDAGIRRIMQSLDDNDVPGTERFFAIPPVEKNRLLGNGRFTEQAFTGEAGGSNPIRTGKVGNLYGMDVYVSANSPFVAATNGTTMVRGVLMAHKDSMILVNQILPRVQSQYKLEFLSDVLVADAAFGAAVVRAENNPVLDRGRLAYTPA